jgi:hypothetical protein
MGMGKGIVNGEMENKVNKNPPFFQKGGPKQTKEENEKQNQNLKM